MNPKNRPHGRAAKGWISPQVSEALRLLEAGMSWRKAAKQAGCSTTAMQLAKRRQEAQQCGAS